MELTDCPSCGARVDKDIDTIQDPEVGLLYKCPKCGYIFYEKRIVMGRKKLLRIVTTKSDLRRLREKGVL